LRFAVVTAEALGTYPHAHEAVSKVGTVVVRVIQRCEAPWMVRRSRRFGCNAWGAASTANCKCGCAKQHESRNTAGFAVCVLEHACLLLKIHSWLWLCSARILRATK
jgi:hypothetical protein